MTERKELIERLRDATEGPRMLINEAADMLEADAVPPGYGWLTACDEEMICYHLGVANLSDSYESAKRKLRALIDLNVAIATDPAVNGGMSLQPAVPQEPNNDEVICPACCTQFRAIPVNVQRLLLDAGFEPPFKSAPKPQRPRLTDDEIFDIGEDYSLPYDICSFARAIEAKVRGEA